MEDDAHDSEGEEEAARGFDEADRRGSGRVQISTEVTLKSTANFTAAASDLSVGGIYVVTERDLPVGALIDLEFTVEGIDREFELLGEVKWRQLQPLGDDLRCGIGIEFLDLDPEDREALADFVEEREPLDPSEAEDDVETAR